MSTQTYVAAMAVCPAHRLFDRLGDRWVTLVLKALADGPRRSGDLSRTIAGASRKMLTQTLRGLERDGLVARSASGDVPPHVEYRLTPLGAGLYEAMAGLIGWAEEHMVEIDAARAGRR